MVTSDTSRFNSGSFPVNFLSLPVHFWSLPVYFWPHPVHFRPLINFNITYHPRKMLPSMSFYAPKFNFDEKSLLFWNTQGVHQDNVYITLLSRDTGNISSNILLQKLTRSLRSLVRFSSRILDSIFSSIPRQEGNIDTFLRCADIWQQISIILLDDLDSVFQAHKSGVVEF